MKSKSSSCGMSGDFTSKHDDIKLTSAILEGSERAWHDFAERYSGLILGVIRRQIFEADEDQVRTIYVEILSSLYNDSFKKYQGRSSLSTWLIVYTRNKARDYLRRLYGRTTEPTGFSKLNKRDKLIFKLFYIEMLPLDAIVLQLRWNEPGITIDDVVRSVRRVEKVVNPRYLNNLVEKCQARRNGIRSVLLARYLINISIRNEINSGYIRPDAVVREREAGEYMDELRRRIAELSEDERTVLDLRFNRGLSARAIADEMEIGGQRRVYTILDRSMRKLRKSMETK